MNFEAIRIFGGGAIVLFIVIAPLAVWWHRRKAVSNGPGERPLTATGLIVMGGMVLALLIGAIFGRSLLTNVSSWACAILIPAYILGVTLLAAWISTLLERRGYPYSRPSSGNSPPNKSLERSRDR
jgi:hypothetical protein